MKSSFLLILILFLGISIIMPVSDVYSLRQMAGIPEVTVYPGGAEEFTWGLVSDSAEYDTIVNIKAEGQGSEFLIYPESVLLEPGVTEYVTILVEIPDDHKGVTSYSPSLFATEFGEKGDAVVINISMEKKVNITVTKPPTDAPSEIVQQQQIEEDSEIKQNDSSEKNNNKGGGCLIATAVYGTELAPQVQFLREIRDDQLLNTQSGTAFMAGFNQLYYSFSPHIADMQRTNPIFQETVRLAITPMISTLSIMTLATESNSDIQVLGLGITVIALNLAIYVGAPAFVGFKFYKYSKTHSQKKKEIEFL